MLGLLENVDSPLVQLHDKVMANRGEVNSFACFLGVSGHCLATKHEESIPWQK